MLIDLVLIIKFDEIVSVCLIEAAYSLTHCIIDITDSCCSKDCLTCIRVGISLSKDNDLGINDVIRAQAVAAV